MKNYVIGCEKVFGEYPEDVFLITEHTPFGDMYIHKLIKGVHYYSKPWGGDLFWGIDESQKYTNDSLFEYYKTFKGISIIGYRV